MASADPTEPVHLYGRQRETQDAQWLDRPTANVLTFVARRLQSDPIVMLFAVREGSNSTLLDAGLDGISLAPLRQSAGARRATDGASIRLACK